MSDRDLGVEVTHDADVIVVTVHGELDLSTAPMLGTTLEQFGPGKRVVLKMSDVEFIDSTSLTVVLAHDLPMRMSIVAAALTGIATGLLFERRPT